MKIKLFLCIISLLAGILPATAAESGEDMHPFLLVKESEYEHLRELAQQSPWKELKETALQDAAIMEFDPNRSIAYNSRCEKLSDTISATALAFILDPDNQEAHKAKILDLIDYWNPEREGNLYDELYKTSGDYWTQTVPPGSAFVNSLVALDIVYPALSAGELKKAEGTLEIIAENYWAVNENHMIAVLGVRGMWALYKRDWNRLDAAWPEFLKHYDGYITEDGVGTVSTDYANGRFSNSYRDSKTMLPIAMEYTGRDNTFYNNPKFQYFAEWLLGYCFTPAMQYWANGDTDMAIAPANSFKNNMLAYRAANYSEQAAEQAAWLMKDQPARGRLMNYLCLKEPWPEPKAPQSRIFPDGGAWFYENFDNKNSLAGMLWNAKSFDGHGHKEINAANIAGYGETLTANSGYNGWGAAYDGYTWEYINNRAISANTVLVNYEPGDIKNPSTVNDHVYKYGAGIEQGFTAPLFGYARGDSGEALPNGKHDRSMVMVGAQDGVPGYFMLMDEITTGSAGDVATVVHRPFSDKYETLSEKEEYQWTINRDSGHDVGLSIFLATPPDEVEFIDGAVIGRNKPGNIKSLLSKYKIGPNGSRRASAVLFPSDSLNAKAKMERITCGDSNGAAVDFENGIIDYTFQSNGGADNTYYIPVKGDERFSSYDRAQFSAENVMFRKINGALGWYFAENARNLLIGQQGFHAEGTVSVYMKQGVGKVYAPADMSVTFKEYGVTGAKVNGAEAAVQNVGNGSITIRVPQGESQIELLIEDSLKKEQMLSSKVANGQFGEMIAIDIDSDQALVNGVIRPISAKGEKPAEVDNKIFIPAEFAAVAFGSAVTEQKIIDGTAYVPIRSYAESLGKDVLWCGQGVVIITGKEANFDLQRDLPVYGLILRLFDRVYETSQPDRPIVAQDIRIDGKSMSRFDPDYHEYNIQVFDRGVLPEITVDSEYEATIQMPEQLPGKVVITLRETASSPRESTYILNISFPKYGMLVEASDVPEPGNVPENTLDGNLETRWSAEGDQWIQYDLGEEKTITGVKVAWYLGDQRTTKFDVQVSRDAVTWETVYSGQSSGNTAELESVPMTEKTARYVRVYGHGNSQSMWNSPTEVEIQTNE